jgi:hypothetical protein
MQDVTTNIQYGRVCDFTASEYQYVFSYALYLLPYSTYLRHDGLTTTRNIPSML